MPVYPGAPDGPDPEPASVLVDEVHCPGGWGSSSRAKKAEAALRIVGPTQLLVLARQLPQAMPLVGRQAWPLAGVGLRPPDPLSQRLVLYLELLGNRLDRFPLARVLVMVLKHHPHCPLPELSRVRRTRRPFLL